MFEKDAKMKYNKLLKDMKAMYDSRIDEKGLKYVRPFEKIINNTLDKEVNIMTIIFIAVEKF